jgi:hypothetical protein
VREIEIRSRAGFARAVQRFFLEPLIRLIPPGPGGTFREQQLLRRPLFSARELDDFLDFGACALDLW